MGLIGATSAVFRFFNDFWHLLPVAIKLLVQTSFLGVLFLSVLMHINR